MCLPIYFYLTANLYANRTTHASLDLEYVCTHDRIFHEDSFLPNGNKLQYNKIMLLFHTEISVCGTCFALQWYVPHHLPSGICSVASFVSCSG